MIYKYWYNQSIAENSYKFMCLMLKSAIYIYASKHNSNWHYRNKNKERYGSHPTDKMHGFIIYCYRLLWLLFAIKPNDIN